MFPPVPLPVPRLGLLVAMTSATSFVIMDGLAQYLQAIDPIDSVSLMLWRMGASLVVAYGYLWWVGHPDLPLGPPQHRRMVVLRSCLNWGALLGFFVAVRHIQLADAITVYQTRPFLMGYFSELFLGEGMSFEQQIASGFSILGELFIAKPFSLFRSNSSAPSSAPISGPDAISHSTPAQRLTAYLILLLTLAVVVFEPLAIRSFNGEVHPALLLATFSLASVVLSAPAFLIERQWPVLPSSLEAWLLLFALQMFGMITQVALAMALKMETAVTISLVSQFQASLCLINVASAPTQAKLVEKAQC